MDNRFLGRFQLTRALGQYRLGHFADSMTQATMSLEQAKGVTPGEQAQALLIIAMSQFHLEQTEESKKTWTVASRLFEGKLPRLDCGELGPDWIDYVAAYALLEEAAPFFKAEENGDVSD
jgi:hypothetical protein